MRRKQLYIRQQGRDIQQGEQLIAAGVRLSPDHLLLLAENGSQQVKVYRRPRVAVICTGSELVKSGEQLLPGQKISSNGILLASLLQVENCRVVQSLTVGDDAEMMMSRMQQVLGKNTPDLLISTGGMGPGKYDLMEQIVARLGGRVIYNRLKIRPGKATLFAMIGNTPFFALPGPPPAVRLLYHELVAPGLQRLQGALKEDTALGGLVDGVLAEAVDIRRTDHLALKGAVAGVRDGRLYVRAAGKLEPINAIMHLPCKGDGKTKRGQREKNQRVKVRLVAPLAAENGSNE
ncbi:MAG: hypothetical protein D3910_29300 [Candidatus Electrothrix sp. ATG2]|nr:hypothetical protein [Candidatus Electrothrix sp. ATG2]